MLSNSIFKREERAIFDLRQLYCAYGYTRYKVSKFEEYDLYAHNKSFLVSENVLTFTDTNGKLMALKPDVTLSIVKNVDLDLIKTHKVYYNETVYRTASGSDGFREIMQTGLECIGEIDLYAICEVLMLAERSLALICENSILDLSHMGFVRGLLEEAGVADADVPRVLGLIGNKNVSELRAYCIKNGVSDAMTQTICRVTDLYAPLDRALSEIEPLVCGEKMQAAYRELCEVADVMRRYGNANRLYLDFSMVQDMRYYNGIVFRGYINGLPDSILSGGRYDKLIRKMGKSGGAIGFAVYLDALERLDGSADAYDADVLLVCSDDVPAADVIERVEALRRAGKSVRVSRGDENAARCRETLRLDADLRGGDGQ